MKKNQLSIAACMIILISQLALADEKLVWVGQSFVSPDGAFSVQRIDRANDSYLVITNNKSGQSTSITLEYAPVLTLQWSSDSKTIATVEHIAEGSLAGIIHFDGSRWIQTDLPPPESNFRNTLVKWKVGEKSINLVYKVTDEVPNSQKLNIYQCSFDVDPQTGKLSNVKKVPLSEAAFDALKPDF